VLAAPVDVRLTAPPCGLRRSTDTVSLRLPTAKVKNFSVLARTPVRTAVRWGQSRGGWRSAYKYHFDCKQRVLCYQRVLRRKGVAPQLGYKTAGPRGTPLARDLPQGRGGVAIFLLHFPAAAPKLSKFDNLGLFSCQGSTSMSY
jgi:hypothetical protein